MALLLAASLLTSGAGAVPSDQLVVGPAAHYAPSYDHGGWERIIARHIGWGQIDADTFPYSADGYYCVHPDHALGDRLRLVNAITGATLVCTVADAVAPGDMAHWRANVVIELSWAAFVAADGPAFNIFVVTPEEG